MCLLLKQNYKRLHVLIVEVINFWKWVFLNHRHILLSKFRKTRSIDIVDFFNCQEVVLYETLVILGGKSFKNKEFFHSTQTIADKTGIKRHSVDKILKKFKEHGIIEYQIKGMPKVKYITLLWDNIMELLPVIERYLIHYFKSHTKININKTHKHVVY